MGIMPLLFSSNMEIMERLDMQRIKRHNEILQGNYGRNRTQTCDSHYAGIMLDDPTIALYPKLRRHTDLTLVVREKD